MHELQQPCPAATLMNTTLTTRSVSARLGEICVALGKISEAQLADVLEQQRRTGQRIGDILHARGLASERDIAEAMAFQLDVPFCPISDEVIDREVAALLPAPAAYTYSMLPFARLTPSKGDDAATVVRVAMLNPADAEALDLFERLTGLRPEPQLAERGALRRALEAVYGAGPLDVTGGADAAPAGSQEDRAALAALVLEEAEVAAAGGSKESETTPVGGESAADRLMRFLVADARRIGATDVHLEPAEGRLVVRARVGGRLRDAGELPKAVQGPLLARLKTLAHLDPAERRLPQDGRLTVPGAEGEEATEVRVATLPNLHGERIALRLSDPPSAPEKIATALDDLGLSNQNRERLAALLTHPSGLLLVAGPSGSGLTTTLYFLAAALRRSDPSRAVLACEERIESEMEGVSQSAVEEAVGLTYARQLRAVLLQDPDVIVLGALADPETAAAACRAASRGHLILAALPAEDAVGAVARLVGMGVAPYLVASALSGVVGQRLVRKLCLACRAEARPTGDEAARLGLSGEEAVYTPVGCPECRGTGYRGHIALHEVLTSDGELARAIKLGEDKNTLRSRAVVGGMVPLVSVAAARVRAGLTSPAEALRALPLVGHGATAAY